MMLLSTRLIRTIKEDKKGKKNTNNWLSAIKRRGIPLGYTRVLAHAEDFEILGWIWNIWGETIKLNLFNIKYL